MLAISWTDILAMIFEGFRTAGLVAAGGAADSELLTPSGIVSQGDVLTIELGKSLAKGVAPSGASNPIQLLIDTFSMAPKMVMVMITLFVVKACFFWMAFSLVLVNIEFAMFTCITMLMMPFGMLRWTETYFNKAVNGVFHFGIKMMVLYFLLRLLMSNTETFTWMSKTAAPIGSTIGFGDLINHMALIFLTALRMAASGTGGWFVRWHAEYVSRFGCCRRGSCSRVRQDRLQLWEKWCSGSVWGRTGSCQVKKGSKCCCMGREVAAALKREKQDWE